MESFKFMARPTPVKHRYPNNNPQNVKYWETYSYILILRKIWVLCCASVQSSIHVYMFCSCFKKNIMARLKQAEVYSCPNPNKQIISCRNYKKLINRKRNDQFKQFTSTKKEAKKPSMRLKYNSKVLPSPLP